MFAKLSVIQQPVAVDTKTMELSQQEMVDASSLKIGRFAISFELLFFRAIFSEEFSWNNLT